MAGDGPSRGEQRCHGACNPGQQPRITEAQAWEIAGRPQTHCEVNHHLPPSRAPRVSLFDNLEYLQSHIPPLTFKPDGLVETELDANVRNFYRLGATDWEVRFSRILNLSAPFIANVGALATPIIDDTSVLAYVSKEPTDRTNWWLRFRTVDGEQFYQERGGNNAIENDPLGDLVLVLFFPALIEGIAEGAISAAVESLGSGLAKITIAAGRGISEEAGVAVKLFWRARRARALVAAFRRDGVEVIANIGGELSPAEIQKFGIRQITLNPCLRLSVGNRYIPFLVKEPGENIGKVFARGSLDRVVSRELDILSLDPDRIAKGAFNALRPGGRLEMAFHAGSKEASEAWGKRFVKALVDAGCENLIENKFFGTVIKAVR